MGGFDMRIGILVAIGVLTIHYWLVGAGIRDPLFGCVPILHPFIGLCV
jgi:hypothetical protein